MSDPRKRLPPQPPNGYEYGNVRYSSRPPMPSERGYSSSEAQSREYYHYQQYQQRGIKPLPQIERGNYEEIAQAPHLEDSYQRMRVQSNSTNIQRSKSLTRPERQRPKQSMISHAQQQQHQQQHHRRHHDYNQHLHHRRPHSRPMSSQLQQQLEVQKQSQTTLPPVTLVPSVDTAKEDQKEPKVLTSWWAWIAFICTCCFPPIMIEKCFGKTNKNMQQAWREKVSMAKKK